MTAICYDLNVGSSYKEPKVSDKMKKEIHVPVQTTQKLVSADGKINVSTYCVDRKIVLFDQLNGIVRLENQKKLVRCYQGFWFVDNGIPFQMPNRLITGNNSYYYFDGTSLRTFAATEYSYTGTVNVWTENGIINSGIIQAWQELQSVPSYVERYQRIKNIQAHTKELKMRPTKIQAQALRVQHPFVLLPVIGCRVCGRMVCSEVTPFCSSEHARIGAMSDSELAARIAELAEICPDLD